MASPPRLARLMSLLSLVGRKLQEEGNGYLKDIGLSASQLAVMRGLWQGDRCTLGELSGQCCCAPPNITGLVDRLEKKGLVERLPDPGDRRVVRVVLTEAGRELTGPAQALAREHLGVLEEALTPRELAQLIKLLEKIYRRQAGEAAEAVLATLGGDEG